MGITFQNNFYYFESFCYLLHAFRSHYLKKEKVRLFRLDLTYDDRKYFNFNFDVCFWPYSQIHSRVLLFSLCIKLHQFFGAMQFDKINRFLLHDASALLIVFFIVVHIRIWSFLHTVNCLPASVKLHCFVVCHYSFISFLLSL